MASQKPIKVHPLEEDFEDFFENALHGFVITDSIGIITRANSRMAEWVNISGKELRGKRFSDMFAVGSKIYYETHLAPLLIMQGYFEEVVLEINQKSGVKLQVLVTALVRTDASSQPSFIRYTILKATDRIQYEKNLLHAKIMAENEVTKQAEIVALRDQFIAVLGHDLRNPLAAVSMAVDILVSNPGKDAANLLMIIKRSNARMMELVTNIMDFTRTRLGQKIVLTRQEIFLEPVLQHIVDEMKVIYPEREIKTFFNLSGPVFCDSYRIAQLVSNLTGNAFTHGDVRFPVILSAHDEEGELEISVSNKGAPISKELQKQIFEPFKIEGHEHGKKGLGLGLFICAEIARAHDATLNFNSTEEETRFVFLMERNKV